MEDYEAIMSGIADIIKESIAPMGERLDRQKKYIVDLEARLQKAVTIIGELDAMLRPPPVTGLPELRRLVYVAFTFFNNGAKPGKGTPEFNMKIEGNKQHRYGNQQKEHVSFATMYRYGKFRKEVLSKITIGTDEQRAILRSIAEPYADDRNMLFGLISQKGGLGGTTMLADQLVILRTSGEGGTLQVENAVLMVGADKMPIDAWKTLNPKTGEAWGAANIVARAFVNPQEYFGELDEDAAYGLKPEVE